MLNIIPYLTNDLKNRNFLYQSIIDELQRYAQNLDVSQELKKMLLEIGRKLFMTDEEYKNEVQEVSQEGFLKSIQFMKNK